MSNRSRRHILQQLRTLATQAQSPDQLRSRRVLRKLRAMDPSRSATEAFLARATRLEQQLQRSVRRKQQRLAQCPRPTDKPRLPITDKKVTIIDAIQHHRVVVISGETGSGKSTQLPQFCLWAGRGIDGQIGCTQPRRIAASTVARRIAEELQSPVGRHVGYKIRFHDRTDPKAFIKIMTDGMLLAETQSDPWLYAYDTLIVDEAHERSLNIDLVLGILRRLMLRRSDLKLIITSATLDTQKFSQAFDGAPVIEVSGRMYPVTTHYVDPGAEAGDAPTHVDLAVEHITRCLRTSSSGDLLVFMPTEQDIRDTCDLLAGRDLAKVKIMPLFARLSAADQTRVFKPMRHRKIIVATNVAETSITIPGIKYVIDTGLARIARYIPRSRTTALPVVPISRSSADQRQGRCGRVADGVCIRLYSEADYLSRPVFTTPEIHRANLAEVILRMLSLRLGPVAEFPFIDPPPLKQIQDGFSVLLELGAIRQHKRPRSTPPGEGYRLTDKGHVMAKIPLDPRLSRILIEAHTQGCSPDAAIIASALSIQDPRERPAESAEEADHMHAAWIDPQSDFLTLLNIWRAYHQTQRHASSTGALKRFCRSHYLSYRRMREWIDIHRQIVRVVKAHRLFADKTADRYAALHKSILSGFLSNVALRKVQNLFRTAKGREAMLFPGSGLFGRAPDWIVASEMVETSRLFARSVASIEHRWIEEIGREQCHYGYRDPRWDRTRGEVVASEEVRLYGLVIVAERMVAYGPIQPQKAATTFIRQALMTGDMHRPLPFVRHNLKLVRDIRDMEARLRRRDILVPDAVMQQFYQKRLPQIYDVSGLRRLIRQKGNDRFLHMRREMLMHEAPDPQVLAQYPDRLRLGRTSFACHYRFDPGRADDGLTVRISASQAHRVPLQRLDWLVPGLMPELIETLVKGLPKAYRKRFVPVGPTIATIVAELPRSATALPTALSRFVAMRFGVEIPAAAWPMAALPEHLRVRVAITGPGGKVLRSGRDKSILNDPTPASQPGRDLEAVRQSWERVDVKAWEFGDLPTSVTLNDPQGNAQTFFPGLEADGQTVNLRLFSTAREAEQSHRQGVAALYRLRFARALRHLAKTLRLPADLASAAKPFGGLQAVEQQLVDTVVEDLFAQTHRTRQAFDDYAAKIESQSLHRRGRQRLTRVTGLLQTHHATHRMLTRLSHSHIGQREIEAFIDQRHRDVDQLVPQTFVDLYDTDRLGHLERYVRAIGIRAQRGVVNLEKDRWRAAQIEPYHTRLQSLLRELSPGTSPERRQAIEAYYWLLEEYKVSLFAQEIKTPIPVSPKRLDRHLSAIDAMV